MRGRGQKAGAGVLQRMRGRFNPEIEASNLLKEDADYTLWWEEDKKEVIWNTLISGNYSQEEKINGLQKILEYPIGSHIYNNVNSRTAQVGWQNAIKKEVKLNASNLDNLDSLGVNSEIVIESIPESAHFVNFDTHKEADFLGSFVDQNLKYKEVTKEEIENYFENKERPVAKQYVKDLLKYLPQSREVFQENKDSEECLLACRNAIALLVPAYLTRRYGQTGVNIPVEDTLFAWQHVKEDWQEWTTHQEDAKNKVPVNLQRSYNKNNNIIPYFGNLFNLKEDHVASVIENMSAAVK